MTVSCQNFTYYAIKKCDNSWTIITQPSTVPYSQAQFIKAHKVLLKGQVNSASNTFYNYTFADGTPFGIKEE